MLNTKRFKSICIFLNFITEIKRSNTKQSYNLIENFELLKLINELLNDILKKGIRKN